jgi:hypothetical protein
MRLSDSIRRYRDQIDTLKKPNTYREYDAISTRFDTQFSGPGAATNFNRGAERARHQGQKERLSANTVSAQRHHHRSIPPA